jgi:hypothetical protein
MQAPQPHGPSASADRGKAITANAAKQAANAQTLTLRDMAAIL